MTENNGTGEPNAPPQADLAGYPSTEALVAGYRASGDEAKKWRERAQALEQVVTQQVANPPREVNQRARPEDRLAELGVPVDALDEYFNQKFQAGFQPITRQIVGAQEGRTKMLASYGADYAKHESDIAQYVASDPDMNTRYQRMFEADPGSAMDYAYLKYGETRRKAEPQKTGGSREQVVEASIPSSRQGGSPKSGEPGDEQRHRAWEHFQKTGDAVPYAKARLGQAVSDAFLNE